MIAFFSGSRDFSGTVGRDHFVERTGLSAKINPAQESAGSAIVIFYGTDRAAVNGQAIIWMAENGIQDRVCGKISGTSGTIPVCQVPQDTGPGDQVLATFDDGTARYPCITKKDGGYLVGIDIFRETGRILSGHLDSIHESPDPATRDELATLPVADLLEDTLMSVICSACHDRGLPLVRKSPWPDGKPFAVCLTHDVDELVKTYQWITRPLRALARRDLAGLKGQIRSFLKKIRGCEPYDTYDDIIGIEGSFSAHSTYFILKETGTIDLRSKKTWFLYGRNRSLKGPEMKALLGKLLSNGDEIGVHGSYFSYEDFERFNAEMRELEEVTGERVSGNRQHNLNMAIPATWEYHVRAGLRYDTSLGFKDRIGFRWGTAFPFSPNNGEKMLPLIEIPLAIMDICLGACRDKEMESIRLAERVNSCHGVLTLLWHPPMFNAREYPESRELYIRILRHCRDAGAWLCRGKDIADWITYRNSVRFTCRSGDTTVTIVPEAPTAAPLFFTVMAPEGKDLTVLSHNAEIIKKENDCVYIRTGPSGTKEITLGVV